MNREKHTQPTGQSASLDMKTDSGNGDDAPPDQSIGAFLRDERGKKELSYSQLAEITKLRPSILEALENESWDDLPSLAFASGFIRSYGRALGLEETKIRALYKKFGPAEVSLPKPLTKLVIRKKTPLVLLIFLLLAIISVYYLWKGYSTNNNFTVSPRTISPTENPQVESEKILEAHNEFESVPPNEQHKANLALEITLESDDINKPDELSGDSFTSITAQELTLKINIREETWLRIFVDDQEPKEYIFRPEEKFVWKAKRGFELLVGNAGGIDLELNGEEVETSGKPGQVVRLTFPKDYERRKLKN